MSGVGVAIGLTEATMGPNEFRRMYAACLDLAGQSNVPGMRDRWLAMAQGWVELANNDDRSPQASRKIDHYKPNEAPNLTT
jgi:hypothetical protein